MAAPTRHKKTYEENYPFNAKVIQVFCVQAPHFLDEIQIGKKTTYFISLEVQNLSSNSSFIEVTFCHFWQLCVIKSVGTILASVVYRFQGINREEKLTKIGPVLKNAEGENVFLCMTILWKS